MKRHKLLFFQFCFLSFPLLFVTSDFVFAQRNEVKKFEKSYEFPADKLLRVDLKIDAAEVKLRKSSRERMAYLTVFYTENEFEVHADYDRQRSRLSIELEKNGWVGDHDNLEAQVILELPSSITIDFHGKIKAGEVEIDLGGLSLIGIDLSTWAGEVLVDFSEPNKIEIDHLRINTKIGVTNIVRLGNARFKEAEINGGIGEMRVDFRGEMLPEATAEIDLDIGETNLYLPDDLGVKLAGSKFLFLSHFEIPNRFKKSGKYYYTSN